MESDIIVKTLPLPELNSKHYCVSCGKPLTAASIKNRQIRCHSCKGQTRDKIKISKRYYTTAEEVINHYGGVCAYCGSTSNLQIDHIDGNGAEHRKAGKGKHIYKELKAAGYPEGYQVLCRLHNLMKTHLSHNDFVNEINCLYVNFNK